MKVEVRMKFACFFVAAALFIIMLAPSPGRAQGTLADYQRGRDLQDKAQGLVVNVASSPNWIAKSNHFWYSRSVKGGTEFVLVDATTAAKKPAFDHERLAAAISAASGKQWTALRLPFAPQIGGARGGGAAQTVTPPSGAGPRTRTLEFVDQESAITFGFDYYLWRCTLTDYKCTKEGLIPQPPAGGRGGRGGAGSPVSEPFTRVDDPLAPPEMVGGDPVDGFEYLPPSPQIGGEQEGGRGRGPSGCAPRPQSQAAQSQGRGGAGGGGRGGQAPAEPQVCGSLDGKWDAYIYNFNVYLRPTDPKDPTAPTPLSFDGWEDDYYTVESMAWSPDSKKLVASHTTPGYDRQVHYIQSSPENQIQPIHSSILYRKPGDTMPIAHPALFDIAAKTQIEIDRALFPNAYSISRPVWWRDGRAFTFEYNQRGHQVYRVIEVDAQSGKARALIDEVSSTFIDYRNLNPGLSDTGKKFRRDLNDGKEIIWASERDGWEHLYLHDGVTGKVKNQITKGEWVVRSVDLVDEQKRQIWFQAAGMNPGQDPYFSHYYRINFDGTGLVKFTEADGNHTLTFSPDRTYYVDSWQKVNMPPVAQLRRTEDQKLIAELEQGDASALLAAGFRYTEVFVAKGRDGKTDIWGTIVRPTNFDPKKKYPVIEQIYAGPQGSFVPKTFPQNGVPGTQALAELGFIVVQIDGMGTSNRSKAFHDVAWKNLGDAGFPDRILWHKAVAARYPYYDITRVGIYGTSAGGQNSLGGALFYPEFYKVVVTNSGCHDNRMDKIWWNEQWMGWPIGPQYAASSNVDNAHKLVGKALIIIPEMDDNVDPASSLQVVNALIKARKHFDMLYVPGQRHGAGVLNQAPDESGRQFHFLQDYFVRHLLGVEPPDWNKVTLRPEKPGTN